MEIKLKPSALKAVELQNFKTSKRFLNIKQNSNFNEILIHFDSNHNTQFNTYDKIFYFINNDPLDQFYRKFIHETYPIFTSLQRIQNFNMQSNQVNQLENLSRISNLYKSSIESQLNNSSFDNDNLLHWANIYAIWSLTQLLYFPLDGRGEGIVAEELLDWINRVDVSPTSEEGLDITSSKVPYEHDNFWPYIYKSILRGFHKTATQPLHSLLSHPTKSISNIVERLISLLYTFPRSTNFSFEHDYFNKHKIWRDDAKRTLSSIADLSQYADEFAKEMFDNITLALQLLCGKKEKILEMSDDWRECLAAYGLFVYPQLRRDDIPSTLDEIFSHLPLDTTLPDQVIEAALANAEITKAITLCNEFDPWLVAHLTDLLDKINAVDHDPQYPLTLRQYFLLQYADKLASDPGLWTITLDYYAQCGIEGAGRVRTLIVRIPLLLDHNSSNDGDEKMDSDDVFIGDSSKLPNLTRVEEILSICVEYGLEEEASEVCRNAAEQLVEKGYYGLAVAFCIRAKEARKLGRITDLILEEFIHKGHKKFIELVGSIPTSLLNVTSSSNRDIFDDNDGFEFEHNGSQDASARALARDPAVSSRLAFLARYKDFQCCMKKGEKEQAAILIVEMLTTEIAPRRFWSVLLVDALPLLEESTVLFTLEDTYELLRFLEDVHTSVNSNSAREYLDPLARIMSNKKKSLSEENSTVPTPSFEEAINELEIIRLALARHIAKCCVLFD